MSFENYEPRYENTEEVTAPELAAAESAENIDYKEDQELQKELDLNKALEDLWRQFQVGHALEDLAQSEANEVDRPPEWFDEAYERDLFLEEQWGNLDEISHAS